MGPCGLVGLHGSVYDVDKMSLEDASRPAGALGGFVSVEELSRRGVVSLLHYCRGVEHAVQTPVPSAVQSVSFLVSGWE